MKKFFYGFFLALLASATLSMSSCKKDDEKDDNQNLPEYIFGIENANYQPFVFYSPDNPTGIEMDIIAALAEDQQFTYKFVDTPLEEVFVNLDNGDVDAAISFLTITKERKQKYDVTIPYAETAIALTVNSSNTAIGSFADLSGKKVAVLKVSTMFEFAEFLISTRSIPLEIVEYQTSDEVYESVINGTADACLTDKAVSDYLISSFNKPLKNVDFDVNGNIGIMIHKSDDKSLLNTLNAGLVNIINNGTLDRIFENYYKSTYQIALTENYPPFCFYDEAGNLTGVDVELLEAISKDQNIKCESQAVKIAEVLNGVRDGRFDIAVAPITYSYERDMEFDFLIPYFRTAFTIFTNKNVNNINSLADLNGKTVAVQSSTIMADYLVNNSGLFSYSIIYCETAKDVFTNVYEGKVDAGFNEEALIEYANVMRPNLFYIGNIQYNIQLNSFIVNKGDNLLLKDAFNRGLTNLMSNGKYDEIMKKYFGEDYIFTK